MYFKKNEKFTIGENETFVVEDLLGEGGQGEVYFVSNGEQKYALKIYKGEVSRDFRFNLKNNIEKGSPSEDFLWPKRLFERADGKAGYLMDLRPENYVSFVSYLTGTVEIIEWRFEMINFGHETEELEFKKSTSEMHDAMKDIVAILIQR